MKSLTAHDPSAPSGLRAGGVRRLWPVAAATGAVLVSLAVAFGFLLTARKRTVDAVVIVTLPSGADVTFDGASLGPAPVRLEGVRIGEHSVRVAKDGFLAVDKQIDVSADTDGPLEFDLKPIAPPGSVARTPAEQIQEFTGLAEDALARGDYVVPSDRSALYYADAISSLDPNNAYARQMRDRIREALASNARAALRQKDLARAQEEYEQLSQAFPGDQETAAALASVGEDLRRETNRSKDLLSRGEQALKAGRLVDTTGRSAYAYAAKALAIDPEDAQALALKRRVRDAALEQAASLVSSGKIEEAASALSRLVALYPQDRSVRSEFDRLMAGEALEALRSHRAEGLDAYRAGNYRVAVDRLQSAVALGAADSDTRAALGLSLLKLGDATRARRELERSVVQDGSQREALVALGDIADRNNDARRALDYYRRARRLSPPQASDQERLDSLISDLERRLSVQDQR